MTISCANKPSIDLDRRRFRDLARQNLHDGAAGDVALDAHDAATRMRRLLRGLEGAEGRSRSNGAPIAARSSTRARASCAMPSAMSRSTMPPPAATVSSAWISGVSPSSTAAAMPPCAQKDEPLCPTGVGREDRDRQSAPVSARRKRRRARRRRSGCGADVAHRRLVDRDGGEPRQRLGLTVERGVDKRARAFGQGQGERGRMALGRHFAQGLAENVDDLVVVVIDVFGVKIVEIMLDKDDRRDILQRLRFADPSSIVLYESARRHVRLPRRRIRARA